MITPRPPMYTCGTSYVGASTIHYVYPTVSTNTTSGYTYQTNGSTATIGYYPSSTSSSHVYYCKSCASQLETTCANEYDNGEVDVYYSCPNYKWYKPWHTSNRVWHTNNATYTSMAKR